MVASVNIITYDLFLLQILAMEHSMKKPWNYIKLCGLLNWGMVFLILIHIFVGSIGYLKWGHDALGNFIRNHEKLDG